MSALTVKFSPLKLNVDSSLICLHSPHHDSLHLVTSNFFCCLSKNFVLVNNFFRFGGCHLLFKNIFCLKMAFILSSLKRIDLFCRICGYISGLFGLNVVTYGIKLLPLLVDSFCVSKSDLFRALIFAILSSMRDEGYFCFKRNVCSSSSPTSSVLSSKIIIFNLLAKLY